MRFITIILLLGTVVILAGCGPKGPPPYQGYLEGDFVYMASPYAGQLVQLHVSKGQQVKIGQLLFALDNSLETMQQATAASQVAKAEADLADAKKGVRPEEIAGLEAEVKRLEAACALSKIQSDRMTKLYKEKAVATKDYDTARYTLAENLQALAVAKSNLATAKLGSREDQVKAAADVVKETKSDYQVKTWMKNQKSQTALQDAVVFDTLCRKGEWVPAGQPVVVLLPANNLKVRFFVRPEEVNRLKAGTKVSFNAKGMAKPVSATITYISPKAEFTPPVIYSKECRDKLVYMIEASISATDATGLNVGQPVDVTVR